MPIEIILHLFDSCSNAVSLLPSTTGSPHPTNPDSVVILKKKKPARRYLKQFHLLYLHPISPSLSDSPTGNKS